MAQPIKLGYSDNKLYSRVGSAGQGFQSAITDDSGKEIPLDEALARLDSGERLQLHTRGKKAPIPIVKQGKHIVEQEKATKAQTFLDSAQNTIETVIRGGAGITGAAAGAVGAEETSQQLGDYAASPTSQHAPASGKFEQIMGSAAGSMLISGGLGGGVGLAGRALLGSRSASVLEGVLAGEVGQASAASYKGVYDKSIQQGRSEEEANFQALQAAFGSGLITKGISKLIYSGAGKSLEDAAIAAGREPIQETLQETGQQFSENVATGDDWTEGLGEAAGSGFLGGLGIGTAIVSGKVSIDHLANINEHAKQLSDDDLVRSARMNAVDAFDGNPEAQAEVREDIELYERFSDATKNGMTPAQFLAQLPEEEQKGRARRLIPSLNT